MQGKIKKLKSNNEFLFPITRAEAVFVEDNKTLSQKLIEMGSDGTKIIIQPKILTLGNSFSANSHKWLVDISKSAGLNNVVSAHTELGSATLSEYATGMTNNKSYSFRKDGYNAVSMPINDVLTNENWDFIILHQASAQSGQYNTFQPYLNNIITHIRSLATNPNLKIAFNMTWAYSSDSTHGGFVNYNNDQLTMYNAIVDAYKRAMQETEIDVLIPCGTSIQNGRTSPHLSIVGRELTADGYHLETGIGQYIAGLTYFEKLIAQPSGIDIFTDVSFVPSNNGGTKYLSFLSKLAVKNAVINPFKITEI